MPQHVWHNMGFFFTLRDPLLSLGIPKCWKWCWERLKAGEEGDDRGWDGWMASSTRWTWVSASFRSWWWTGKPGVLQSTGVAKRRTRLSDWTDLTPIALVTPPLGRSCFSTSSSGIPLSALARSNLCLSCLSSTPSLLLNAMCLYHLDFAFREPPS